MTVTFLGSASSGRRVPLLAEPHTGPIFPNLPHGGGDPGEGEVIFAEWKILYRQAWRAWRPTPRESLNAVGAAAPAAAHME
jgi:hypothetical protein